MTMQRRDGLFCFARVVFVVFQDDANNPRPHARKALLLAIKHRGICTKRCRCHAVSCEGGKSHRCPESRMESNADAGSISISNVQGRSLKSSERHFFCGKSMTCIPWSPAKVHGHPRRSGGNLPNAYALAKLYPHFQPKSSNHAAWRPCPASQPSGSKRWFCKYRPDGKESS